MNHSLEQKNIAKNTIFLYIRMIVVMGVSLFTSRVVLDKLGVDDYGVYNIVGSIVVAFVFVQNSLTSATQRFLSYSKGAKDKDISSVFSTSMIIHLLILAAIVLLLETVGLWFLENVIKIPDERRYAASIVYQLSVLTFCFNLLRIPYNALIVSNEKMSIYAYISILDVVLKLCIAYLLSVAEIVDRLILYGILMTGVTLLVSLAFYLYCKIKINKECRLKLRWDKNQIKEQFSFSFWNLFGGVTSIASIEGPNYFMNFYLGVKLNAAMGIAKQVSHAVYGFTSSFQTAFNPQIVKAYASGENDYLFSLIFRTSKLSFLLIYVISVPLIICSKDVLNIWLTVVPEYTQIFCVLMLLAQLLAAISSPFWMAAHAIGDIRNYQLKISVFNMLMIPASWAVLALGYEPYWILAFQSILNIAVLIYRVQYLKTKINFPARKYYTSVALLFLVIIPLLTIPELVLLSMQFDGFVKIVVVSLASVLLIVPLTYFLGFDKYEREAIGAMVRSKLLARKIG